MEPPDRLLSWETQKGRIPLNWGVKGKYKEPTQDNPGESKSPANPVYIKAVGETVDARRVDLNSQYYIVRLLYRDREIILGDGDEQVTIPDIGVDELTIDIVSRGYLDRPLGSV